MMNHDKIGGTGSGNASAGKKKMGRPRKGAAHLMLLLGFLVLLYPLSWIVTWHHRLPTSTTPVDSQMLPTAASFDASSQRQSSSAALQHQRRLDSYNPKLHPVYEHYPFSSSLLLTTTNHHKSTTSPSTKLRAGLVTSLPLTGESYHFLADALNRSSVLEWTHTVYLYPAVVDHQLMPASPSVCQVWIVDGARVAKMRDRPFLQELLHGTKSTSSSNTNAESNNSPIISWKVLFVDYSDQFFPYQLHKYRQLGLFPNNSEGDDGSSSIVVPPPSHVRVAVRSIVQGRNVVEASTERTTTARIVPGEIVPNIIVGGGPLLHASYGVRSDVVNALFRVTKTTTNTLDDLSHAVGSSPRPLDVRHFWQGTATKKGKSKYRNQVSRVVQGFDGRYALLSWKSENSDSRAPPPTTTKNMTTSIAEVGLRHAEGRNSVQADYVQALLSTKIVIVTQKDTWEDHYRLMEALVGGALVIADAMMAPPDGLMVASSNGDESQDNIVWFHSPDELPALVSYYLTHDMERQRIAYNGWKWAMAHHRSWHRLEMLLFGQILTPATPLA